MGDATTTPAADDTGYLQSWLDSGRDLPLGPRNHVISSTLRFTRHGQKIEGMDPDLSRITCAGRDCREAISAISLAGVEVSDLTIDCACAARLPGLRRRTMGVFLVNCVESSACNVRVTGTVGGPDGSTPGARMMSGVGIAISGGERCLVRGCTLDDLGFAADWRRSDGIYTSGVHHLIDDCDVDGATDTAFVIEDSDYSGVVNSRAKACCGILGITAATRESRGNFADGITAEDWASGVVGGVQLAALAGADLVDTAVYGLKLIGPGIGPAVNIRTATGAAGRVVGVMVREPNLTGSGLVQGQGLLIDGDRVFVDGPAISGFENGIQIQPKSAAVAVRGIGVGKCWRFPVVVTGPASGVALMDGEIDAAGCNWGVYLMGGAQADIGKSLVFNGASRANVGRDSA